MAFARKFANQSTDEQLISSLITNRAAPHEVQELDELLQPENRDKVANILCQLEQRKQNNVDFLTAAQQTLLDWLIELGFSRTESKMLIQPSYHVDDIQRILEKTNELSMLIKLKTDSEQFTIKQNQIKRITQIQNDIDNAHHMDMKIKVVIDFLRQTLRSWQEVPADLSKMKL